MSSSPRSKPKSSSTKLRLVLEGKYDSPPSDLVVVPRLVPWEAVKDLQGQSIKLPSKSVGFFMVYDSDADVDAEHGNHHRWKINRVKPPEEKKDGRTKRKKQE